MCTLHDCISLVVGKVFYKTTQYDTGKSEFIILQLNVSSHWQTTVNWRTRLSSLIDWKTARQHYPKSAIVAKEP